MARAEKTMEQKIAWVESRKNEELLEHLLHLERTDSYGCNWEAIQLCKAEILKRMSR